MITNLDQLKNINKEVEFPPFVDGTPFIAKIKRASLINMLCDGKISNPLTKIALSMISGENNEQKKELSDEDKLGSLKFMMTVVKNCLVEPTYQQITDCGLDLTDNQIMAIFSYALGNAMDLAKFCGVPDNS